jgi:hypothetical protein
MVLSALAPTSTICSAGGSRGVQDAYRREGSRPTAPGPRRRKRNECQDVLVIRPWHGTVSGGDVQADTPAERPDFQFRRTIDEIVPGGWTPKRTVMVTVSESIPRTPLLSVVGGSDILIRPLQTGSSLDGSAGFASLTIKLEG